MQKGYRILSGWPEWTVVVTLIVVTALCLLPSRPNSQNKLRLDDLPSLPPAPTRFLNVPIIASRARIVTHPLAAIRIHVAGIPIRPDTVVSAALDGTQRLAEAGPAVSGKGGDIDVRTRFLLAGRYHLSLRIETILATTKYSGTEELDVDIPPAPEVPMPAIRLTSKDVISSVDEVSDGHTVHIVAVGQSENHDVLHLVRGSGLVIEGWAAGANHTAADAVLFRVDNGLMRRADLGDDRPDVAHAFATDALEHAGFTARLSTRGLTAAMHQLTFYVVPSPGAPAEELPQIVQFTLGSN